MLDLQQRFFEAETGEAKKRGNGVEDKKSSRMLAIFSP
jgi:hypothetical protein